MLERSRSLGTEITGNATGTEKKIGRRCPRQKCRINCVVDMLEGSASMCNVLYDRKRSLSNLS